MRYPPVYILGLKNVFHSIINKKKGFIQQNDLNLIELDLYHKVGITYLL